MYTTRNVKGEHYKYRRNWEGFTKDWKFPHLKNLSKRLAKHNNLMCAEFFEAPYKILGKDKHYGLDFFSSMRAISTYVAYLRSLEDRPPDDQFEFFKKSIKFIYDFCLEKKLKLSEYPFYSTISQNDCFKHIKDHKISTYIAFAMPELYTVIINMEPDLFHLHFGDMDFLGLQQQYERSNKAKIFIPKCLEGISKKLTSKFESGTPV